MKEALTSTTIINIVLIFMVIVFAFILGIIAYYKAFKVNKSILAIIEKYEGYNVLSEEEIGKTLNSAGYGVMANEGAACPKKDGQDAIETNSNYKYCVYYFENDTEDSKNNYYSYGIITYIKIDFPIANLFIRIPLYSKSNRIFRFSN
jgi:hypothetical protein